MHKSQAAKYEICSCKPTWQFIELRDSGLQVEALLLHPTAPGIADGAKPLRPSQIGEVVQPRVAGRRQTRCCHTEPKKKEQGLSRSTRHGSLAQSTGHCAGSVLGLLDSMV